MTTPSFSLSLSAFRERPLMAVAATLTIAVRLFMALFYIAAGINKLRNAWAWSDYLEGVFKDRLAELIATGAQTYGPFYLNNIAIPYLKYFAIPMYLPVGIAVTAIEIGAGLGFLLGFGTRLSGWLALFLMGNFALGGYYDASLLPLCAMALLIAVTPSGRWFGFDRRYAAKYPNAIWFK